MSLAHKIFATLKASGDGTFPSPAAPTSGQSETATTTSASPSGSWNERFYHIAVQGCCHGELDRIYDSCSEHERQTGKRIDVLLCCGDFQAVRTARDMDSMAVPDKYKVLGDFHKYYADVSGAFTGHKAQTLAPYLTIFVGGNHENSDLLAQESYGGFVAPNVFYLGHSSVVTVDNCLTIAGLSGIFKDPDYDRPYPPRPYAVNPVAKKSAYHVRRIEVAKLHAYLRATQKIRSNSTIEATKTTSATSPAASPPMVDLFLSHDWPVGITGYGDEAQLLRFKPYFKDDIRRHALGNPYTMRLLQEAKAPYWFAAHLHCYFEATVEHPSAGATETMAATAAASTKFVALDKCAKGHGFLTFIDLPRVRRGGVRAAPPSESHPHGTATVLGTSRIRRDPVWLEVLRVSHQFVAANRTVEAGLGGGGFDVDEAVKEVVASYRSATRPSAAALLAPTTETLLAALQLSPALPLQQMAPAAASPESPTKGADGRASPSATRRDETVWQNRNSTRCIGGSLQPHHPRARTEATRASSVSTAAPKSSTPLWYTAGTQPLQQPPTSALRIFEDVGPTGCSSAPSSTSGMVAGHVSSSFACTDGDGGAPPREPAATTLSWFEDTTQQQQQQS
ncbi:conserved hypothetical protein [Leishmania infantum JPCM5]|uniref:Lariat_debranching_enzyme_-_C-terminal_domain_containing_protein_-_putative n=2 Tax=Leishmania infantum TaxID=5671 RepID=A0A6L0XBQ4_LEIIN|nr:conserved hypothetical protein [Leishmania infantum JPCM5]CAC9478295.1 Lariat_debranching_enzyme_-_C-terminal_domain_containing_protein_-_putative [Leishmania infantum]CAM59780.1 conserved hypothetical protein [Leishmania infantum JPCM5]SUZ40856.1 Lariat_debranching_enzyme_-_C-terminal_domain_containing_protein_-_putative [Leishmania infantum]|eukprot:XP_001464752.1 conserved hypothetical protein [Leishmania infantum JPCM5]